MSPYDGTIPLVTPSSIQSRFERRLHVIIRSAVATALFAMAVRRLIYLRLPNFLPSNAWHPDSRLQRWAGIVANTGFELLLQLTLLGAPVALLIAYRRRVAQRSNRPLVITASAILVMYGAAWVLLQPPSLN